MLINSVLFIQTGFPWIPDQGKASREACTVNVFPGALYTCLIVESYSFWGPLPDFPLLALISLHPWTPGAKDPFQAVWEQSSFLSLVQVLISEQHEVFIPFDKAGVGGSCISPSRSCLTTGDPVSLLARLTLNHPGSISLFQRNIQVVFDLQTYGLPGVNESHLFP